MTCSRTCSGGSADFNASFRAMFACFRLLLMASPSPGQPLGVRRRRWPAGPGARLPLVRALVLLGVCRPATSATVVGLASCDAGRLERIGVVDAGHVRGRDAEPDPMGLLWPRSACWPGARLRTARTRARRASTRRMVLHQLIGPELKLPDATLELSAFDATSDSPTARGPARQPRGDRRRRSADAGAGAVRFARKDIAV